MQKMIVKISILGFLIVLMSGVTIIKSKKVSALNPDMPIIIPTEGNSWLLKNIGTARMQSFDFKDSAWNSLSQVLRTYFRVEKIGKLDIGIRCRVSSGKSTLEATFNGLKQKLTIDKTSKSVIYINSYDIPVPGYYYIDLKGITKISDVFAEIDAITLGGSATANGIKFVNEEYFYWGRRGPSVHLSYQLPAAGSEVVYFYNEITVPKGNDVIGSYYMANGFAEGYFGIQVNSVNERRVLFSVWSPYETQDPSQIPPEYQVILLGKGKGVTINAFGNEGSGGQSYLVYNWKAGKAYRFLLKGEPTGNNKTNFTAYFYAPETGNWKLIASWQRPFTNTYLTKLYSFLENFETYTGSIGRQAFYNNQWVFDTKGQWHELTSARFTTDATGRDKARLDYAGGFSSASNGFYLKNCGFFSDNSIVDSIHTRNVLGIMPDIKFENLPMN